MMDTKTVIKLLQELIYARGPGGQEDEVRIICERELAKYTDKTWVDKAGNVIGLVRAKPADKNGDSASAIKIMAHMDELAMAVKRILPDGTLRVMNIGELRPCEIGQGPVDVLADTAVLPGVLSLGSLHTTRETVNVEETRNKPLEWSHLHVFTNKTREELAKLGVHAGTKVTIARERRKLFEMDDCIGGYFMDDRAAIAALIAAAALIKSSGESVPCDIYFVMTTGEETGGSGAAYASRTLPGDVSIAVEIGPICEEYGTEFEQDPIIVYGDSRGVYNKSLTDKLLQHARNLGQSPQQAVWENFGSDVSFAKSYGQTACAGLISIPTLNTHGFEIIHRESIRACAELLNAYLRQPD